MLDGAVLLWVHGGGWHSRDITDVSLFADLGLRVVHARYRLSGEATWPAQLDDVRAAARAARAPGRPLLIAGDSAGAHLALHVGLRGVDAPGDVTGVVALEPPVDPLAADWPRGRSEGNPWHQLLGHRPAPGDPATLDCTVTTHVGNGTPVLLVHGLDDAAVPATQSLDLATALIGAGHRVHVTVTDGEHGALDLRRPDLAAAVGRFLAQVTATAPAR
ncbi:alpha/beta hydrolase [Micromonospora sp. NPDC126480]|uniref:alpha/beta hydrolase n=1 Tax=Micromonospora sp. NPDC126480 TaxID=3155312 RepID=UPI0033325EE0